MKASKVLAAATLAAVLCLSGCATGSGVSSAKGTAASNGGAGASDKGGVTDTTNVEPVKAQYDWSKAKTQTFTVDGFKAPHGAGEYEGNVLVEVTLPKGTAPITFALPAHFTSTGVDKPVTEIKVMYPEQDPDSTLGKLVSYSADNFYLVK